MLSLALLPERFQTSSGKARHLETLEGLERFSKTYLRVQMRLLHLVSVLAPLHFCWLFCYEQKRVLLPVVRYSASACLTTSKFFFTLRLPTA